MKNYGNVGQAVTCENEPHFEGFATTSGRDVLSDLARAHDNSRSPIKLQPLDPAAERALISGRRPSRAPRKPAQPARLPAPAPAKPSTPTPTGLGASSERRPARGGQTTREDPAMTVATGCSHAQLLAWAAEHPRAQIRARGERIDQAIRDLIGLRRRDTEDAEAKARAAQERAAAAAQVEALRRQLREAEARLRPARRASAGGVEGLLTGESTSKIRSWALTHGLEVGRNGRLPQHVLDAYRAGQAADEQVP